MSVVCSFRLSSDCSLCQVRASAWLERPNSQLLVLRFAAAAEIALKQLRRNQKLMLLQSTSTVVLGGGCLGFGVCLPSRSDSEATFRFRRPMDDLYL